MVFCTQLSNTGCRRTVIYMSPMTYTAGYSNIKDRMLPHSVRWIFAITKLCILPFITLHFTSQSISHILQEGLTNWAQNWTKKSGLFHTKCLFLVFSRATYWKYFFNLDCKARAMMAQYGFFWPKKITADILLAYIIITNFHRKKKKGSQSFLFKFLLWRIKIKTTYTLRLHRQNAAGYKHK